jgi:NAD(P)-dependent dehydrogenase (short-subunit alcohol dehydrogenase family)
MSQRRRVLITGASAGFGYNAAKALAERGHTVFATMRDVAGRRAGEAAELERWARAHDRALLVRELDVADEASVQRAFERVAHEGGVDVVVNNAGTGTCGIDEGYTIEQAQQIFAVNLFGAMRVNRAALPAFRAARSGLFIYVSSGSGRLIVPFMGIYSASKFALEAYAESASYELAPLGIDSVILEPGSFGTGAFEKGLRPRADLTAEYGPTGELFRAFFAGYSQRAQAGALGDPAEVVDAIVEEVERPAGQRPLRRPVGRDSEQALAAINRTCEQVQQQLRAAMRPR